MVFGATLSNPACRHLTYRSSGHAKARCARVSPPLTSTLGPVSRIAVRPAFWFASSSSVPSSTGTNTSKRPCEVRQSSVPAPLNARRYLGHPSVGGRLTANAAGRSFQGTAILSSRASVPVGFTVPLGNRFGRSVRMSTCVSPSLRGLVRPSKLAQWNARLSW